MQRVLWKSKLAMVSVLFLPSSTFSVSPYPYLSVGSLYKIFNLRSDGSRIRKYVISAPKTFKNHRFDDLWYLFQHLRYCDSILRHPFKLNIFNSEFIFSVPELVSLPDRLSLRNVGFLGQNLRASDSFSLLQYLPKFCSFEIIWWGEMRLKFATPPSLPFCKHSVGNVGVWVFGYICVC